jgi:anti-sigma factor (TIGR02949 family)
MDCKMVQQRIYRFIYGESDAHELSQIKDHLEHCGGCRREREIIEEILAKIKQGLTDEPVPITFKQRVLARVHALPTEE